jgi:pimeloyl-ACP methyl ester carboxylesterase
MRVRWIWAIAKWLVVLLIAAAAAGALYNQIGLARDASLAPPAEEMISVKGRKIHVACTGEGPRTFLLDAGLAVWSFEWFRLQPLLAQHARVCAFDRSGMGWSDDLGGAHDGAAAAAELHDIVAAAGIQTPFFYVGHSLGANFAQTYHAKYPADIAGLVLLEPGDPIDLLEDFKGTRAEAMSVADCDWTCTAAVVASHLGVARLAVLIADPGGKNLPPDPRAQYRAGLARASTLRTTIAYLNALPKTAHQNLDIQSFGATPVLTIASASPREREADESAEDFAAWGVRYRAHLAALSAKSQAGTGPIVVPDSTHASMVLGERQAAWVADAILKFAD